MKFFEKLFTKQTIFTPNEVLNWLYRKSNKHLFVNILFKIILDLYFVSFLTPMLHICLTSKV